MKFGIIGKILGHKPRPEKRLIAVTSERTGDHSLSGVESFLNTIGVPEPFSLELAGDSAGVTLLARCREGSFVKQQVGAFYPQARVSEVSPEDDPLRLAEGERAWSMNLRLRGPEYLPLRTFRDDDLKEPGSDPLVSLIGAMSGLGEGERLVARIKLLSLGPDWARQHQQRTQQRQQSGQACSPPDGQEQFNTKQAVSFVILGLTALVGLRGYFWVRDGETWKAALLGLGVAAGLVVAGWAWWRIKRLLSGDRHHDPLLIKEKVDRLAYDAQVEVVAVLSEHGDERRAREMLRHAALAYRGYDNPAGASFRAGKVRPIIPETEPLPPVRGMWQSRNVLGGRELASLWHLTSGPAVLSLEEVLERLRPGGSLPVEPPLARRSPPRDLSIPPEPENTQGHLLPVVLKASHKGVLDRLAEWPLITAGDLRSLTGLSPSGLSQVISRLERLGLAARFRLAGRSRLSLTRRGLTYLARRDRTSAADAVRRWSVESANGEYPADWREVAGTRSRPLARTIEHTDAVHRFLGRMSRQAREMGCRVVQLDPPHRAVRRFRHHGRLRSIHPDAFGILRRAGDTFPFFLEWERRAVRPGAMAARLAPYLRYYSSKQPLDDHGEWPLVLVVFDDELAESNFHGVARREMDRTGADVPLWVSHAAILERAGPLGKAWRSPEVLEPTRVFQ